MFTTFSLRFTHPFSHSLASHSPSQNHHQIHHNGSLARGWNQVWEAGESRRHPELLGRTVLCWVYLGRPTHAHAGERPGPGRTNFFPSVRCLAVHNWKRYTRYCYVVYGNAMQSMAMLYSVHAISMRSDGTAHGWSRSNGHIHSLYDPILFRLDLHDL